MNKQIRYLLSNKLYLVCVCLALFVGYGFLFSYVSISIDDTSTARYVVEGTILQQGRWGLWLLFHLIHQCEFNPFLHKACGMAVFFLACVLIAGLLRKCSDDTLSIQSLTAFTCIVCTYSLFNEILFYENSLWSNGSIYLFAALAVWFLDLGQRWTGIAWAFAFLTLGISVTEVAAGVFIILVLASMILMNHTGKYCVRFLECIKLGLISCSVLILSIIAERWLASLFCWLAGVGPSEPRTVRWLELGFTAGIRNLVSMLFFNYGLRAVFYFPIAEYVVAMGINICIIIWLCFRRKGVKAFLWTMFAVGSVAFSIAQGEATPNRVICLIFSIYIAFIVGWFYELISKRFTKQVIKIAVSVIAGMIVMWQVSDLNTWIFVNYMRTQEELGVVDSIGRTLESTFDIQEKPVVFVRKYQLSENILQYSHVTNGSPEDVLAKKLLDMLPFETEYQEYFVGDRRYRFNETGVNSVIAWSVDAFNSDEEVNTELINLFRYRGYVLQQGTEEMYRSGLKISGDMPAWPKEGSIVDMGEYILVNFGH